jgi:hypothetical protein
MKNIVEVLRSKERELDQLQGEIDALRVALRLVSEEGDNSGETGSQLHSLAPTGTSSDSRLKEVKTGSVSRRDFP